MTGVYAGGIYTKTGGEISAGAGYRGRVLRGDDYLFDKFWREAVAPFFYDFSRDVIPYVGFSFEPERGAGYLFGFLFGYGAGELFHPGYRVRVHAALITTRPDEERHAL